MNDLQPKTRKRNRKRKRRLVSDSSSEESSSDTSTTENETVTVQQPVRPAESTDEESEEDVSSEDDSDNDSVGISRPGHLEPLPQRDSPSPRPTDIPPFISPNATESELALKEKFRKFWMASIAEGFKDDLEEIRKEPNLGPSRLALLVESLASGANVFSSSSADGVNEMEVVLNQLS